MIWLVGGTAPSKELSNKLCGENIPHIVTTATEYGKRLYKDSIEVAVQKMNPSDMEGFIKKNSIEVIIDATHPYASEVRENTLKVSEKTGITHLRLERKAIEYNTDNKFDSYKKLVEFLRKNNGRVLITTGSNNIDKFRELDPNRLVFRVLPVVEALEKLKDIKIPLKNIIALQGPFSKKLNKTLIEDLDIEYIVTKESGIEGGELEKVEAAMECNRELLVIKRPIVEFKEIFYSEDELIERIRGIREGAVG